MKPRKSLLKNSCIEPEFGYWAFGEDLWKRYLKRKAGNFDLVDAWNERHSDIFNLMLEQDCSPGDLSIEVPNIAPFISEMRNFWEWEKDAH